MQFIPGPQQRKSLQIWRIRLYAAFV